MQARNDGNGDGVDNDGYSSPAAPTEPLPPPMGASESLSTSATLQLGERLVVRCDDGLLATEYALFEPTDIVLRATDPVTVREMGYITTARDALARLTKSGITPELAHEAGRAMVPEVVASFARVQAGRMLATELGPSELFEGGLYRSGTQRYDGTWLDLRALSSALRIESAAAVLQALHLVALLAEVDGRTAVHLATANATRSRRPGERTHRRVTFDSANAVPGLLSALLPGGRAVEQDARREEAAREALLGRVRERGSAEARPEVRAHLARLENALAGEAPPLGPLADTELWSIERKLAAGDAGGVDEQLDQLEAQRGRTAGTRYLRARAALVRGDEPPRKIAQTLSAIVSEEQNFHEAELVAARAWLAAGEDAHARYFAHRLADDAKAADSARLVALEILDATARTHGSQAPPAEPPQRPPATKTNATGTRHETRQQGRPSSGAAPQTAFPHAPPGASMPPVETMPPPPGRSPEPSGARAAALLRYDPEIVEALALPLGATEDVLVVGDRPTTALQARTAMTRLARSLGRDYRLWYGTTLRCNVLSVDAMQRHLTQRYAGASLADPKTADELLRHGALLSEILARALGGEWVDIAPTEPGYWAMVLPPAARCWPIGRVYRFVALGHRERDLVSYYMDLEARVRGGPR